ncbi:SIS domain-containing protein [Mesorhizobium sp.]|uniref:SIS domain-containing protein n=1 Tax=Mesorhizobium sp. TaxID=1871066 RepID=UPI0025DBCCE9|nr:SIS domain-containing protein [Mesorhizobium sp.]
MGPDTLVVLCSQTGTTKETVRAANHAKDRGATTIGMTLDQTSPLARAVDHQLPTRPRTRRAKQSMQPTAMTACSTCCSPV